MKQFLIQGFWVTLIGHRWRPGAPSPLELGRPLETEWTIPPLAPE
ncbi:MAG: hypothetical protein ACREOG_06540 [Gemmatimonadaceae bacterium]